MAETDEFAQQVLRAVAFLFEKHPRAETLTFNHLLHPPVSEGRVDTQRLEYAIGTLRWLHRSDIIHGDDDLDKGYLVKAQLSLKTYMKLLEKDSRSNDSCLGATVVRAARDGGSRDIDALASQLLLKLATTD